MILTQIQLLPSSDTQVSLLLLSSLVRNTYHKFLFCVVHSRKLLVCFSLDIGAAYGTAKAGSGISSIGVWKPSIIMKSLIPVVMAGILGIYGMIVSVILI